MARSSDALIERIYEAAFVPDMWDDVLDEVAQRSRSASGALFVFSPDMPVRGRSNRSIRDLFERFVGGPNPGLAPSVQRMMDERPASFVQVDDFMSPEEIESDPARVLLRSARIGVNACSAVVLPEGAVAMFTFNRWLADGSYDAELLRTLDSIRPHLARASLVAERLGLERARTMVSALAMMGLPAAVLSDVGRVVLANELFDAMSEMFLPVAFGGLAIADAPANKLFQECIARSGDSNEPLVRSIPLKAAPGRPAAVLHLLPLLGAAHDIFSGADILMVLTEIGPAAGVPAPRLLSALFDLSPAEARLSAALAAGKSLKQAASDMNVSFGSARTYLARVFAKTGTNQQSQLVALLKSTQTIMLGTEAKFRNDER